jgi:hypothetical protein
MILPIAHSANLFRVEVSGWDDHKCFFVENSELDWSEETGKQVILSHGLANGTVVFLRLLQPISADRGHPVAYQAEFVSTTSEGHQQFRLRPISARQDRQADALSETR